ncbi:hypothetical protein [Natronorubrum sp. FCH18a]|uniref:hypothetical protein n=1 Tax=Natronorubrum sp. FCH18a TaxID=3447018 RepID=UPI003F517C3B
MVSRDTSVHVGAVLLGIAVLVMVEYVGIGPAEGPTPVSVFLLFYGLVLGGAHFYLAVRGEDGLVPVDARWRYVAMLAVLLVAGAVVFYGGERTVATVELEMVGLAAIVLTLLAYFVSESVAGYRASRSQ